MQRGSVARYRGPDRRDAAPIGGYRGPDRRTLRVPSRRAWLRVVLPIAMALLAVVLLIAVGTESAARDRAAFLALRNLSSVLLLLAGAAYGVSWRLTGRAASARNGAAFLVVGGLMLPLQAVALVLHTDPELQLLAPGCGLALGAAGVAQCIRSTRCRSVDASARPSRDAAPLTLGALSAVAVMVLIRLVQGPLDGLAPWVFATALLGAGWLLAAGCYARPAAGSDRRPLLVAAVGCLGAGNLFLAAGIAHNPSLATAGAALLSLGGALALAAGLRTLESSLGQQGNRSLRLAGELGDTVRLLAQEQAAREEMLHDARSALAAVRLANGTLSRYQERLDELLAADLRDAVDSELGRLEHLLTAGTVRDATPVQVGAVLAPVIRVAGEAGLEVAVDLEGLPAVLACGEDLGAVVHTLLTNAGRYAAGSPVEVRGRVEGSTLRVTVSDRGPGVDPDERERIFQRGERGRSAVGVTGSGLGLFIARWLMDEMGGDLHAEPRPGGGATFVASMPLASSMPISRATGEPLASAALG